MEDNELQEVDTPIEETQEIVSEEVETTDGPTLEDYEKLKKERETLLAQKEHWKKKATAPKAEPLTKTNETQALTREEAILFAKGYSEEEVELAKKLSKINGTNPLVAVEDDYFKSKVEARIKKEKSERASLSPSGTGRYKSEKPVSEMTEEEHRAYFNKIASTL